MSDLSAIANCAWRVREMLNLNLPRIAAVDDPVLGKNVVDALNDLSQHLPLSENGPDWNGSVTSALDRVAWELACTAHLTGYAEGPHVGAHLDLHGGTVLEARGDTSNAALRALAQEIKAWAGA